MRTKSALRKVTDVLYICKCLVPKNAVIYVVEKSPATKKHATTREFTKHETVNCFHAGCFLPGDLLPYRNKLTYIIYPATSKST